ncbi:MAG: hypothetical protein KAT71_03805 [Gammaproteobacteria bacterium]|nr:hypothetical protein [Gammaproteobacteria bacterium]
MHKFTLIISTLALFAIMPYAQANQANDNLCNNSKFNSKQKQICNYLMQDSNGIKGLHSARSDFMTKHSLTQTKATGVIPASTSANGAPLFSNIPKDKENSAVVQGQITGIHSANQTASPPKTQQPSATSTDDSSKQQDNNGSERMNLFQ